MQDRDDLLRWHDEDCSGETFGQIPLSSNLAIDGIKFAGKSVFEYLVSYDGYPNKAASFQYLGKTYYLTSKQLLELDLCFEELDLEFTKSDVKYFNEVKIPKLEKSIQSMKEKLRAMT